MCRCRGCRGLEVAQLIGRRAHIVFITAHERYAVQAFDEGAVGYLLKPLDPVRMAKTLLRLKERLTQPPADLGGLSARTAMAAAIEPLRWITVQRGRELQLITVEDVAYFRADHKYVAVVTADNEALISVPLKRTRLAPGRRAFLAGAPLHHRQRAGDQVGEPFIERQAQHRVEGQAGDAGGQPGLRAPVQAAVRPKHRLGIAPGDALRDLGRQLPQPARGSRRTGPRNAASAV